MKILAKIKCFTINNCMVPIYIYQFYAFCGLIFWRNLFIPPTAQNKYVCKIKCVSVTNCMDPYLHVPILLYIYKHEIYGPAHVLLVPMAFSQQSCLF